MGRPSFSRRLLCPLILCLALVIHPSPASSITVSARQSLASLQASRRQNDACQQLNRLWPIEGSSGVRSEAGLSNYWNEKDEQLQCAGLNVARHEIQNRGLLVPHYSNGHRIFYVLEGRAVGGVVIPGCTPTFHSYTGQGQGQGQQGGGRGGLSIIGRRGGQQQLGSQSQYSQWDEHQKIHDVYEGHVVAVPAGLAAWFYNNGNSPLVLLEVLDVGNLANQLDAVPRTFYLAGSQQNQGQGRQQQGQQGQFQGQQGQFQGQGSQQQGQQGSQQQQQSDNIFKGFDTELLAQALGTNPQTVQKLQSFQDTRGFIIQVQDEFELSLPESEFSSSGGQGQRGGSFSSSRGRQQGQQGQGSFDISRGGQGQQGQGSFDISRGGQSQQDQGSFDIPRGGQSQSQQGQRSLFNIFTKGSQSKKGQGQGSYDIPYRGGQSQQGQGSYDIPYYRGGQSQQGQGSYDISSRGRQSQQQGQGSYDIPYRGSQGQGSYDIPYRGSQGQQQGQGSFDIPYRGSQGQQQGRSTFPGRQGQQGQQESFNGIEETLCNVRLATNIGNPIHADAYSQEAGHVTVLNSLKLPVLDNIELSVEKGHLYRNAILAPYWNGNSHELIYVARGSARIQIVDHNGNAVLDDTVREGQLVLVPQGFASAVVAQEDEFLWVSIRTNGNPVTNQIVGENSVLNGIPEDVLSNAFHLGRDEVKQIKLGRVGESIILAPGRYSQQQGQSQRVQGSWQGQQGQSQRVQGSWQGQQGQPQWQQGQQGQSQQQQSQQGQGQQGSQGRPRILIP